jgi:hypothetical protein
LLHVRDDHWIYPLGSIICEIWTYIWWVAIFYWWNFVKKRNLKFKNQVILEFLNCINEKKFSRRPDFCTWCILCSKNIDRWLRICISHLVCSQIWLNLTRDDRKPCFLHLPMDDRHFGYIQKLLKEHCY